MEHTSAGKAQSGSKVQEEPLPAQPLKFPAGTTSIGLFQGVSVLGGDSGIGRTLGEERRGWTSQGGAGTPGNLRLLQPLLSAAHLSH